MTSQTAAASPCSEHSSTQASLAANPRDQYAESALPAGQREWLAHLRLMVDNHNGKSRLISNSSEGPLRLLRPYYPEGPECVHLYLLHPPGGLVCGDHLEVSIELAKHSKALLTIPSAGKIYRSDALQHPQVQSTAIYCGPHAQLEWLPQETIVYSGSNGRQKLTIETTADSKFILWEITALGRPASQAPFLQGSFTQSLQINVAGLPVFLEKLQLAAQKSIINASWGLHGFPVYGSMLAGYFTQDTCQPLLTALRNDPRLLEQTAPGSGLQWSATRKDNMLLIRALAQQSAPIKNLFHRVWDFCRPQLLAKVPHHPRIWST